MDAVGQPSGKLTFVFTDIEGSTAMLESLGPDAYRDSPSLGEAVGIVLALDPERVAAATEAMPASLAR